MRSPVGFLIVLALGGCGPGGADGSRSDQETRTALEVLLASHLHVLAQADRAHLCRVRVAPMARAGAHLPTPMARMLDFQKVVGRSAPIQGEALARLRRDLLDVTTYDLNQRAPDVLEPCSLMLVLRRGEEARIIAMDLARGVLTVSAGNRAQSPVRLLLSGKGLERLGPIGKILISRVP